MDIHNELKAMMDINLKPEFDLVINEVIEKSYQEDVKELGSKLALIVKSQWTQMKPYLFLAYCLGGKSQAVPEPNALLSASLDAIQKLGSGDFVLVPRVPTEEMIQVGAKANSECLNDNAPLGERLYRHPAIKVYAAMLAELEKGHEH